MSDEMRCRRCWSRSSVRPVAARDPLNQGSAGQILLCSDCASNLPRDPVLRELHLRFASPKELLGHYGSRDEGEAIRRWCEEMGLDLSDLTRRLKQEPSALISPSDLEDSSEVVSEAVPFGYARYAGVLKPATEEATIVRKIFELYADGRSLSEIARWLDVRGVKPPRGARWHRSTLRYMLRNPVYAGLRKRGERVRPSDHPAIIDPRLYHRVQELMDTPHRAASRAKRALISLDGRRERPHRL